MTAIKIKHFRVFFSIDKPKKWYPLFFGTEEVIRNTSRVFNSIKIVSGEETWRQSNGLQVRPRLSGHEAQLQDRTWQRQVGGQLRLLVLQFHRGVVGEV